MTRYLVTARHGVVMTGVVFLAASAAAAIEKAKADPSLSWFSVFTAQAAA